MMDIIDSDLITRIVDNAYFRHQVARQAETTTSTLFTTRLKLAGSVASIVVAVLGALGISQYNAIGGRLAELSSRIQTVQEKASQLDAKLAEADDLIQDAKMVSDAAHANVEASQRVADSAAEAAMRTSSLTEQSQRYATALLENARDTQSEIARRNEEFKQNAAEARTLLDKLGDVPNLTQELETRARDVRKRHEDVVATFNNTSARLSEIQSNLNFEEELAKAKTFEVVLIRTGAAHAATIELPDYRNRVARPVPIYKLRINVDGMSDKAVQFKVQVNGITQQFTLGRDDGPEMIAETPFMVRVDSIYHSWFSYDFALLRVLPAEAPSAKRVPGISIAKQ